MIFIVCRDHVPRGYVGVSWQNIYINTTDSQFFEALLTSNFSFTTEFQDRWVLSSVQGQCWRC